MIGSLLFSQLLTVLFIIIPPPFISVFSMRCMVLSTRFTKSLNMSRAIGSHSLDILFSMFLVMSLPSVEYLFPILLPIVSTLFAYLLSIILAVLSSLLFYLIFMGLAILLTLFIYLFPMLLIPLFALFSMDIMIRLALNSSAYLTGRAKFVFVGVMLAKVVKGSRKELVALGALFHSIHTIPFFLTSSRVEVQF